ncbi:uncharacterized protein LOC132306114 [Cornus florida]|uniref:uncharacterized protein LOC132306114 n=1 Tax=Cornus florida TaxID=4283 RepID=UPI00289BE148|nr:uncharacterized protein LOC132306114 [Cornus florida]
MSEEFDRAGPSTQPQEYDNSPCTAYFGEPMTPLSNLFASEPVMTPSAYEEPFTLKLGRNVGIFRKLADAKAQTRWYHNAKYYPYTSHADVVDAEVVQNIQPDAVRPIPQVSQAEWQPKQLIKYEELTNARSVIVAECRQVGQPIPRPRSLEMKLAGTSDMYSIIAQINSEIRQL